MATHTEVKNTVVVKTWMISINYVANAVMREWLTIVDKRGLPNDYLVGLTKVISDGLMVWLFTQHLSRAMLEIYETEDSMDAVERWDLVFTYPKPDPGTIAEDLAKGPWETYLDKLLPFMERLADLPPGCKYRVLVGLSGNVLPQPPPQVEGWGPGSARSIEHLQRHDAGQATEAGGMISASREYWGHIPEP